MGRAWGAIVAICVLGTGGDLHAAGRKLALLVGCEKYEHAHLTDLEYAEEDVLETASVLKEQGFACTVLTHQTGTDDAALEPTAANIRTALARLLENVGKNDLLLVGLAGHGLQPLGYDEPFFCPQNANPVTRDREGAETAALQEFARPETVVGIGAMLAEIDASGIGHKLVIVDACRNAPLLRGRGPAFTFKTVPSQTGLLLSCSSGQFANESRRHKHGLFFHAVLEGLRGGAADENGVVTFDDLAAYAKRRTRGLATEMEAKQQPHAITNLDGEPIILARIVARPSLPESTSPVPTAPRKGSAITAAKQAGDRLVVNANGMPLPMRWCPAGSFTMGSPPDEEGRNPGEDQVRVTLTKGYWLGETEVTQGFWEGVMGTKPWTGKPFVKEGAKYPATYVSWEDVNEFCRTLTERERAAGRLPAGWGYRLPSEAEWEYGCRAGTTGRYNGDGKGVLTDYAWYDANAWNVGEQYAHEVGLKKGNAWGLLDMHGNVWERCGDWYGETLPGGSDPEGPSTGSHRVDRGGGWNRDNTAGRCRSANRGKNVPSARFGNLGFRLVLTPSRQSPEAE